MPIHAPQASRATVQGSGRRAFTLITLTAALANKMARKEGHTAAPDQM
jgi:hypothetical protein